MLREVIKLFFVLLIFCATLQANSSNLEFIDINATNCVESRPQNTKIDTVIIHTVYNNEINSDKYSPTAIIDVFAHYKVCPHYMIDRNGGIYRFANEQTLAHHAGKSLMPDGRTSVNNFSIGIEVINDINNTPTQIQYETLNKLLLDIYTRNNIKYVLGHKDIAPIRKTDPWNFDFSKIIYNQK